jgi:GntR family transcriptional regulator, transcriptional repressor for pyruvate dehydrogenase complex
MRKFKVGRGTVRAAYRSLQQKGLIEIKHGGGAFVQEIDSSKVGDTLSTLIRHRRISTQHLQEFREAIETRCAAYAAERATQEQINNLKVQIDQMEGLLGNMGDCHLRFYELELNLHTEVAKISGNPMFEWFASTFEQNGAGHKIKTFENTPFRGCSKCNLPAQRLSISPSLPLAPYGKRQRRDLPYRNSSKKGHQQWSFHCVPPE